MWQEPDVEGPSLSEAQTNEFWFWIWCGIDARTEALASPGGALADRDVVEAELDALTRLFEAVNRAWMHTDNRQWKFRLSVWGALDAAGVALLSDYLSKRAARWCEEAAAGGPGSRENSARSRIFEAAHALLRELLRVPPEALREVVKSAPLERLVRRRIFSERTHHGVLLEAKDEGPPSVAEQAARARLAEEAGERARAIADAAARRPLRKRWAP